MVIVQLRPRHMLPMFRFCIAKVCWSLVEKRAYRPARNIFAGLRVWPRIRQALRRPIEAELFGGPPRSRPTVLPIPDFADLHCQRQQRPHVTQLLLWEEYRQANPGGYQYSRFCDPTLADSILDRLVHNAHRIEMRGDSMRKNRPKGNSQG